MSEKVSIWDSPRGMILQGSHTPGSASDDAVDTSLSLIDRDLFYDPNDEELDDYIAQQIKDGFDIEEMFEALPEAFSGIYNQIKETVAAVPNTELKKVPGTAIEALARGGTDTADLLMRIGSGVATMGLKILPGDAATQYHNLPETIKSFSRGWFRQQRTIEQHRAKQMMGDANYSYLPSALVDNTLAEGLTLFADPGMVAGFGASTAARAMAKAAIKGGKSGIVSRGLVNAAVKTGQMQDALFGAVGSVAKLPVTGSVKALQGATEFISEGFEAVKANLPKTTKGLPVEVDIPTEGKIGFLRKKINQASNLADDAMELSSQIKLQSKRQNLPSALDRIARDSSVRPGARDLASMFDAMAKNPLSRGLLIPAYKTGKSISKGAATGGALGLLSFDEEFAASSIAGGAMFGPFGELSSEIIFSKEKNRQQISNFIDDFKVKLDPDDLINFEAFTEGSREDQKFFAGLSYMFKNGHFRNGEGNLDVRFLDDEQYQKFGELRGERFGDTSGVNYISSGGRNTVLINTDKKKYKREALAHELGHAIMKMPEVQDSLQVQDKLLFGDRVVKAEGGKEVLAFNYEGLLNKEWVDSFFENYVNGLDDITQKEYRTLSAEKKFLVARDEIHADSMRYFFKEFDPESFIRAGKVNNLKFRTKGSYERNLYNGLGGSLARGIVNNVLLARNSLGLYAVRNMAKSMGLIKDGTPLKLNDGRVFSNISEILQKKRENIRATDDPITDVIGNKWNLAKLNSKDSRDILSSFLPTVDIIRDENGDPVIRNGRYRFLNKRQRQKHDAERAKIVKEAIDSAAQSGESRMHLSRFQEISNESYSGDYFTQEAIDSMIATSKRVITPHLLDTIMRLNDRMKGRTTDSGFIAEFVYNQVTETGKITPDITTSYRQMVPMIFEMSKTGRNFRVTGIDMNDLMSRLDRFEKADLKSERGKVFDIWRQDYRKFGGKDTDVDLSHNPIRELFLQDLWLYLSGLSEGKSGIDALGGKGNTTADLQTVTQKRDGLMRFLGFEKKDQEAINPNMFQELVDRNRIIKSFRLDRMQNLSISDHDGKINFGSYLGVQLNRMPTQRSSFMGAKSDVIPDASEQTSREQISIPEGDVPGGDDQTLPIYYDRDSKGNIKYEKKDKPKILQENYDFLGSPLVKSIIDEAGDPAKAKKELAEIVTSLNTSKLDDRNKLTPDQQKLYDKIVDQYSDAFAEDFGKWKDDPDILSAIGWYSGVAKNIGKLIPNDADRHIFLEFLGGTSPNTSVEQNFLYAIDLFNRWKSGGLQQYVDARDKTIKAFEDGSLIEQFIEQSETPVYERFKDGKLKKDKKGQKIQKVVDKEPVFEYKWKSTQARNRYVKLFADAESGTKSKKDYEKSVAKARKKAKSITPVDIYHVGLFDAGAIPVRKNGGKYGVHTERVFQIVEGIWERDTDAPKAVNFTGNLKGTRTTATIDVWAARFLRRIGYEKGNAPWRIQPSAEPGVKNADFYFGQDAFEAATKKITRDYGEKFNMTPDDLQAVMWFAEKRNWAQKGWSRVEDFGDFRDYLYKMQQESDGSLKLKDAVLRATSEDFYKSLEFPAEDVQLPTASRKRRVEIVDKIVSVGKRIERARLKVVKSQANFDKAQGKIESAKTDAAKKRTKATALAKKKILQQAQKSLGALHDDLRSVREIRMTLEEKPVTYSR